MEWKDTTSYSRGDLERVPRTWELRTQRIVVVVTRHIDYPGKWLLRSHPINLERTLNADEVEQAKLEALGYVRGYLHRALEDLGD